MLLDEADAAVEANDERFYRGRAAAPAGRAAARARAGGLGSRRGGLPARPRYRTGAAGAVARAARGDEPRLALARPGPPRARPPRCSTGSTARSRRASTRPICERPLLSSPSCPRRGPRLRRPSPRHYRRPSWSAGRSRSRRSARHWPRLAPDAAGSSSSPARPESARRRSSRPSSQRTASGDMLVGHGQCIEHRGAGEAYLPVLERSGGWGRVARRRTSSRCSAPARRRGSRSSPGSSHPATSRRCTRAWSGATRERMLREMAEALDELSGAAPSCSSSRTCTGPTTRPSTSWRLSHADATRPGSSSSARCDLPPGSRRVSPFTRLRQAYGHATSPARSSSVRSRALP